MQAADEQRAARVLPGHAVDSQMYTDAAYDSSESTATSMLPLIHCNIQFGPAAGEPDVVTRACTCFTL